MAPEEAAGADAQAAARGIWTTAHGTLQPRVAPRFDGHAPPDPAPCAERDAHRAEILAELAQRTP
jgi:crotonobetainyl-CoA:carnitine CoA-transferase CaiB-like acyl-CoA transferase